MSGLPPPRPILTRLDPQLLQAVLLAWRGHVLSSSSLSLSSSHNSSNDSNHNHNNNNNNSNSNSNTVQLFHVDTMLDRIKHYLHIELFPWTMQPFVTLLNVVKQDQERWYQHVKNQPHAQAHLQANTIGMSSFPLGRRLQLQNSSQQQSSQQQSSQHYIHDPAQWAHDEIYHYLIQLSSEASVASSTSLSTSSSSSSSNSTSLSTSIAPSSSVYQPNRAVVRELMNLWSLKRHYYHIYHNHNQNHNQNNNNQNNKALIQQRLHEYLQFLQTTHQSELERDEQALLLESSSSSSSSSSSPSTSRAERFRPTADLFCLAMEALLWLDQGGSTNNHNNNSNKALELQQQQQQSQQQRYQQLQTYLQQMKETCPAVELDARIHTRLCQALVAVPPPPPQEMMDDSMVAPTATDDDFTEQPPQQSEQSHANHSDLAMTLLDDLCQRYAQEIQLVEIDDRDNDSDHGGRHTRRRRDAQQCSRPGPNQRFRPSPHMVSAIWMAQARAGRPDAIQDLYQTMVQWARSSQDLTLLPNRVSFVMAMLWAHAQHGQYPQHADTLLRRIVIDYDNHKHVNHKVDSHSNRKNQQTKQGPYSRNNLRNYNYHEDLESILLGHGGGGDHDNNEEAEKVQDFQILDYDDTSLFNIMEWNQYNKDHSIPQPPPASAANQHQRRHYNDNRRGRPSSSSALTTASTSSTTSSSSSSTPAAACWETVFTAWSHAAAAPPPQPQRAGHAPQPHLVRQYFAKWLDKLLGLVAKDLQWVINIEEQQEQGPEQELGDAPDDDNDDRQRRGVGGRRRTAQSYRPPRRRRRRKMVGGNMVVTHTGTMNQILQALASQPYPSIETIQTAQEIVQAMEQQQSVAALKPNRETYLHILQAWVRAQHPLQAQVALEDFCDSVVAARLQQEQDDQDEYGSTNTTTTTMATALPIDQQHFQVVMDGWNHLKNPTTAEKCIHLLDLMEDKIGCRPTVQNYNTLLWALARNRNHNNLHDPNQNQNGNHNNYTRKKKNNQQLLMEYFEQMNQQWMEEERNQANHLDSLSTSMCKPNEVSILALLYGLTQAGDAEALDDAEELLFGPGGAKGKGKATTNGRSRMEELYQIQPTVPMYNTLMTAWMNQRRPHRVEALYQRLKRQAKRNKNKNNKNKNNTAVIQPNANVHTTRLQAWAKAGVPFKAKQALQDWIDSVVLDPTANKNDKNQKQIIAAASTNTDHNDENNDTDILTWHRQDPKQSGSSSTEEWPTTQAFNAVLQSWLRCNHPQAASHIEQGMKQMYELSSSGKLQCHPDLFTFSTALSAHANAHNSPDAGQKAVRLFKKLQSLAAGTGGDVNEWDDDNNENDTNDDDSAVTAVTTQETDLAATALAAINNSQWAISEQKYIDETSTVPMTRPGNHPPVTSTVGTPRGVDEPDLYVYANVMVALIRSLALRQKKEIRNSTNTATTKTTPAVASTNTNTDEEDNNISYYFLFNTPNEEEEDEEQQKKKNIRQKKQNHHHMTHVGDMHRLEELLEELRRKQKDKAFWSTKKGGQWLLRVKTELDKASRYFTKADKRKLKQQYQQVEDVAVKAVPDIFKGVTTAAGPAARPQPRSFRRPRPPPQWQQQAQWRQTSSQQQQYHPHQHRQYQQK